MRSVQESDSVPTPMSSIVCDGGDALFRAVGPPPNGAELFGGVLSPPQPARTRTSRRSAPRLTRRNLAALRAQPEPLGPGGGVDALGSREPAADQLLRVQPLVRRAEEEQRAVAVARADRPAEAHAQALIRQGSGEPAAGGAPGVSARGRGDDRELVAADAGDSVLGG